MNDTKHLHYISEIVSCGLTMSALKQSAMFISGDMLIIVVPQLVNPSGPMLLSLRGHRSKTYSV